MKRKVIVVVLLVMILLTGFIIYRDISNFVFITNKGPVKNEKPAKIAIIDDGFTLSDVKIPTNVKITKYNSIKDNDDIKPIGQRGTILLSGLYNDEASLGLSSDVVLIKAFDYATIVDGTEIAKALDFAREQDATIITMAFNLSEDEAVVKAIEKCQENGITIVTIANSGKGTEVEFPAKLDKVVSVSLIGSQVESDVKVDSADQQTCVNKKCRSNKHIALSTANVAGYLSKFDNPNEEAKGLTLKLGYGINKVETVVEDKETK